MKRALLVALLGALVLTLPSASAQATMLSVTDSFYVGLYGTPEPASPTDEVGYINTLLTVAAGQFDDIPNGGRVYDRTESTLNTAGLPAAVVPGAQKVDTPANFAGTINATGFTYILGKYDGPNGGSLVWYLGGLTDAQKADLQLPNPIPSLLGLEWNKDNKGVPEELKGGLSHYSLYNPVPDGGTTLTLLGGALLALGAVRRKFSA